MCLGPHQVLCIAFPKIEFAEQQSIVQKAREERLEHIQLHKEIQKKDILLHCIVHDLDLPPYNASSRYVRVITYR
jgi:hypothetical protein